MAWTHDQMAARAARELQDGFYVNLGIGLPTLVANFVPADVEVWLQSENGMLGIGPFPTEDRVDADTVVSGETYPQTKELNGGFCVLELPSRQAAIEWAAKLAKACRCPQELREFHFDPES